MSAEGIGYCVRLHENGEHGTITGWSKSTWIVQLFCDGTKRNVDPTQMTRIPSEWLTDTADRRFNRLEMMSKFNAPDVTKPVSRLAELSSPTVRPGTDIITSFWGSEVFRYMLQALPSTIEKVSASNKKAKEMWHFIMQRHKFTIDNIDDPSWGCGIVYSSWCTPQSVATPIANDGTAGGIWWPVLYVNDSSRPGRVSTWCQDQALNGGRPWSTDMSRVIRLRRATIIAVAPRAPWLVTPPPAPAPWLRDFSNSTVTIEEVFDEMENEGDDEVLLVEESIAEEVMEPEQEDEEPEQEEDPDVSGYDFL